MKKYLIFFLMITLCCTACSKKNEAIIDKNVDSPRRFNNIIK